ncbi:hypothetical protein FDC62_05080 [Clostridium botulinum]|uniref:FtsK/SpoIIIE domain-containing protein n=1 Tax=Clostridium botulinum TaxID=1491 RepID=UPI00052E4180|nr:FtsK/SpoIIIE domain-containing protein [Clostridium botulinum]KGM92952.1 hypothetical protein Z956_12915 [Clostridium botulinum D str. CCUG 7971]KOC50115.1 hypothetical protein ADU88_03595 [Clostridium botulinum]NFO97590.1 hypothetical protein [Clostridium botulinum]OOV52885.1 hypothetical protein B1A66_01645 [Clostridium botulinum D/C]OOV54210.1 hypothetical protein B0673_11115 [Clostridium botulinum D/C]
MITELAIAGFGMYAYDKFKERKINRFKYQWNKLMLELGLKNKSDKSYEILNIFKKHYGYDCIVSIPIGKSIEEFNKKLSSIQSFLKSDVIAELSSNKNSIYMRIAKDLNEASKDTQIKFKWYKIMTTSKLRNEDFDTFNIKNIKIEDSYGFDITVSIPNGLGFDKLNAIKGTLESNFNAMIQLEWNRFKNEIKLQVIEKIIDERYPFVPYRVKNPMQLYSGYSITYERLVADMFKQPHTIVSGQTGSGKTEEIRLMLTNLIHNFDESKLELYFSDLSDMCDFECFQNCKQTKYYAKSIKKSHKLFKRLFDIYKLRFKVFVNEKCKNIKEYNAKNREHPMTTIYIVLDEFADYFPNSEKIEKDYKAKLDCYNMLKEMTRKFRKAGMFLIIGIQRPDRTVLDPSLRSNLCTKIGFSQNTDSSSLVASDSTELTGLDSREGLFMYGSKRIWFKSLYINDRMIRRYIKNSIDKEHKYIDIFDDNEFNALLNTQYGIQEEKENNVIRLPIMDKLKNDKKDELPLHEEQSKSVQIKTKNKIYI